MWVLLYTDRSKFVAAKAAGKFRKMLLKSFSLLPLHGARFTLCQKRQLPTTPKTPTLAERRE
jgi:hypothetical protein